MNPRVRILGIYCTYIYILNGRGRLWAEILIVKFQHENLDEILDFDVSLYDIGCLICHLEMVHNIY